MFDLISGCMVGVFVFMEIDVGFDVLVICIKVIKCGDDYILNGSK